MCMNYSERRLESVFYQDENPLSIERENGRQEGREEGERRTGGGGTCLINGRRFLQMRARKVVKLNE